MPTATTTVTQNGATHISLKTVVLSPENPKPTSVLSPRPTPTPVLPSSSVTTIRTLYNRATRAFLHRDIRLTCTLLDTAFPLLHPPSTSALDVLADDRRKWDILRITVESTVYVSAPSQSEKAALPNSLLLLLSETPHTLISKFYARSLALFTPTHSVMPGAGADYIPSQVLATLVLASLKVDCPDQGRIMIENWLARRDPSLTIPDDGQEDGYAKIMDLYCLHVLPKLQQWDYAFEFLEYESELGTTMRERLKSQLKSLYQQSMSSRRSFHSPAIIENSSESPTPRPRSPATSSSSSSSLSTTSTHTIVPSHRANGSLPIRSRSSSISSKSDATARAVPQPSASRLPALRPQNGHARAPVSRSRSKSRTASSSASATNHHHHHHHPSTLHRPSPISHSTAVTRLSTYELIKVTIRPYLTTSRMMTLFVLFVVFPLLSFMFRRRRRRRLADMGSHANASGAVSNAEMVRRRLGVVETGLVSRVWGEMVRAVADTVKMAGSGLV